MPRTFWGLFFKILRTHQGLAHSECSYKKNVYDNLWRHGQLFILVICPVLHILCDFGGCASFFCKNGYFFIETRHPNIFFQKWSFNILNRNLFFLGYASLNKTEGLPTCSVWGDIGQTAKGPAIFNF